MEALGAWVLLTPQPPTQREQLGIDRLREGGALVRNDGDTRPRRRHTTTTTTTTSRTPLFDADAYVANWEARERARSVVFAPTEETREDPDTTPLPTQRQPRPPDSHPQRNSVFAVEQQPIPSGAPAPSPATIRLNSVRARRHTLILEKEEAGRVRFQQNEVRRGSVGKSKFGPRKSLLMSEVVERAGQWAGVVTFCSTAAWLIYQMKRAAALRTLTALFVPRICLRNSIKRRSEEYLQYSHSTPPPEALRSLPFFDSWGPSELADLCSKMHLEEHHAGKFVCLEGDIGDRMYLTRSGQLEVLVRRGGETKGKSRTSGVRVAVVEPNQGPLFGEHAVLYQAPRLASIRAITDVTLWCITSTSFWHCVHSSSNIALLESLEETARSRREQNLHSVHALTPSSLQKSAPIFESFTPIALQEIASGVLPRILRSDSTVYKEGDIGDGGYYIAKGKVKVGGEVFCVGQAFGVFEILFAERRRCSAQCIGSVDLWRIESSLLLSTLLSDPAMFIRLKSHAASLLAAQMPPPPELFPFAPHTLFDHFLQKKVFTKSQLSPTPTVFGKGDTISGDFEGVYFVKSGVLRADGNGCACGCGGGRAGCILGVKEFLTFQPRWQKEWTVQERCETWYVSSTSLIGALSAAPKLLEGLLSERTQMRLSRQLTLPLQTSQVRSEKVKQAVTETQPLRPQRVSSFRSRNRPKRGDVSAQNLLSARSGSGAEKRVLERRRMSIGAESPEQNSEGTAEGSHTKEDLLCCEVGLVEAEVRTPKKQVAVKTEPGYSAVLLDELMLTGK